MGFHATLAVMAAGMGSRFGGLKQIEPVGAHGEAILDYSVYDAKKAGFDKVVFIIKKEIEKDFRETVGRRVEKTIRTEYVFQELDNIPRGFTVPPGRKKPWGTGQAVLCCKNVVKEPFAVINADDFYGSSGYKSIYSHLKEKAGYCMVGYRLGNTVTEHGTVSRGVCDVENGFLRGVTEYGKIDGNCNAVTDGGTVKMSPDTVVSMNMWGFTPDIFGELETDFAAFLREYGGDEKAEFFLPSVVNRLIVTNRKTVAVLPTDDRWYGVTYREDKQPVADAVRALCDGGKYDGLGK